MTRLQQKTLTEAGFSESIIDTLSNILEDRDGDLAKKEDMNMAELRLQKDIEVVRKEMKESELRLQKQIESVRLEIKELELRLQKQIESVRLEIEVVRKEMKESELRLQKEIKDIELKLQKEMHSVKNSITLRIMYLFSPFYFGLIGYIIKYFFFS